MKKIFVGFFLILALAGVVYLVQAGIIAWQPLTMIIAAVAAPFKFIMGLFGSEEKIRARFQAEREAEQAHQRQFDTTVAEREARAAALQREVEALDAKLSELKASVSSEVKKMSIKDKQQEGKDLLGD